MDGQVGGSVVGWYGGWECEGIFVTVVFNLLIVLSHYVTIFSFCFAG